MSSKKPMGMVLDLGGDDASPEHRSRTDPKVQHVLELSREEQIHELSLGLMRQHLVKMLSKNHPAITAFEEAFPRSESTITSKSVISTILGIDAPQHTSESLLQLLVSTTLDQEQTNSMMGAGAQSEASRNFDYNPDNTVDINGITVSAQAVAISGGLSSLHELDLENCQVLGQGAGGRVVKALHAGSGYHFGVKEILLSEETIQQVQAEVSVAWGSSKSRHCDSSNYIVQCYGVFYDRATLFIVMELMDGSLKDLCNRGPVPEQLCKAVTFQVLHGLAFLHGNRKQLHRDIKPHNILFRKSDGAVKLSDFGISSRAMETINLGRWSTYCGTVSYMSPSRVAGKDYSFDADLWGYGVSLLQMALAEIPFVCNTVYAIAMLEKSPPRLPPASPTGIPFSPEMQDFMHLLLNPTHPEQIPQAVDMLRHPWMSGMTDQLSRQIVNSMC